ncbi:MAG TPA: M23 family metallopeptidase [Allosphingosinicella sp.]|jgi:murein DD-endopeptidase MepM/ murein hydrolase activator NlpD
MRDCLLALALLAAAAPAAGAARDMTPVPEAARGAFGLDGAAVQGGLLRGRAPAGAVSAALGDQPVTLAPDGRFLVAFDRDHAASAVLTARMADGRTLSDTIAVAPRTWRIEHVNISQRPPAVPDEAYRIRREREIARIREARAQRSDTSGWAQRFAWPSVGRISGLFGSQRIFRGVPAAYHSGVDVAAGAGAPVVAPADGVVVLAGPPMFSLEGNLVILDHGMGLNSAFLHLATSDVAIGQRVRQGQRIGTIGATGRATGPHLHWSLMWNGSRLDPQLAAGPMGSAAAGASPR